MILNDKTKPCALLYTNIKRNYVTALAYMVLKIVMVNAYNDAHLISSQYQMINLTDDLIQVKQTEGLFAKILNKPIDYINNLQAVIK